MLNGQVTSREINVASRTIAEIGNYPHLVEKYRELAVTVATEQKGITTLKTDDPLFVTIKQNRKAKADRKKL